MGIATSAPFPQQIRPWYCMVTRPTIIFVALKEILLSLDTSLGSKIETEISEICPDE